MRYRVRIENRHAPDMVITDVPEEDVGQTVVNWCGRGTVVTVVQQEEEDQDET